MPDPSPRHLANRARGQWGEDLAARHYERHGYTILDRNWRCDLGELDLVVGRHGLTVFSEVKTRRSAEYGPPAAAVTPAKQQRICRLAFAWMRVNGCRGPMRFDVVAITGHDLEVFEHAFG